MEALHAGQCAGFPAGTGNAHRFVNRSAADAILLVVGDRTAGDEVSYPDIGLHGRPGAQAADMLSRTKTGRLTDPNRATHPMIVRERRA